MELEKSAHSRKSEYYVQFPEEERIVYYELNLESESKNNIAVMLK